MSVISASDDATADVQVFDASHTRAMVNWINGRSGLGTQPLRTDAKGILAYVNFQSVSVAQKAFQPTWNFTQGGYISVPPAPGVSGPGTNEPSAVLEQAFMFLDAQVDLRPSILWGEHLTDSMLPTGMCTAGWPHH